MKKEDIELVMKGVDTAWVLFCGALIFVMQLGFTMLESGSVRVRSVKYILLKNVIVGCVCGLSFWTVSYGLSFGRWNNKPANKFYGEGNFFLVDAVEKYAFFFFEWGFITTAVTIVSGCIAERVQFTAYLSKTVYMSILLYPPVCHWIWDKDGWLAQLGSNGMLDFAGGSVIHLLGGLSGLVGCYFVGVREGRFDAVGKPQSVGVSSVTMITWGVFILWFGWFGFNGGSTLGLSDGRVQVSALVMTNTALSATVSSTTMLFVSFWRVKHCDLVKVLNANLAGLVAVTPACAYVEPWGAIVIGFCACFVYALGSEMMLRYQMDDPVDGVAIHFGCGAFGCLATGLLCTKARLEAVLGPGIQHYGLFVGGGIQQTLVQLAGILSVGAWSFFISLIFYYTLDLYGLLRLPSRDIQKKTQGEQITEWVKIELLNNGIIDFYQFRLARDTTRITTWSVDET